MENEEHFLDGYCVFSTSVALVDCVLRHILQNDPTVLSTQLALVGKIDKAEYCRSSLGESAKRKL